MGLHVAAVDLRAEKLALARELGAELTVDAASADPARTIQEQIRGTHDVLVTAVSLAALRSKGHAHR
jgi:alcohol dehydrogenase, propanol-preferring